MQEDLNYELFVDRGLDDELRKRLSIDLHSNKKLGVNIIENGYVLMSRQWHDFTLEGGIVDSNKHYIQESAYVDGEGISYDFDSSNVDNGKECVYLGLFNLVYGHAITDNLKRLWFLFTEEGKQIINNPSIDIVYITSCNGDIPQWHLRILELAGVPLSRVRHLRRTTKYNKIIIPDNSIYIQDGLLYYCDEFCFLIDKIKKSVMKSAIYEKTPSLDLYFTRVGLGAVFREIGELSVQKVFSRNGFVIYSPERLSIDEQISLLMRCKRFATTEGSCSHSSIFCNPSTEVIILQKANYINLYSLMIHDFCGNKTTFIDVNHSDKINNDYPMVGPFFLYVSPELRKFANIRECFFPYYMLPTYWMYKYSHTYIGIKMINLYYRFYYRKKLS